MNKRENRRMIKLVFFPKKTALFGHINTFTFGAWSFLLVHIPFTPSEGPKGFVN